MTALRILLPNFTAIGSRVRDGAYQIEAKNLLNLSRTQGFARLCGPRQVEIAADSGYDNVR